MNVLGIESSCDETACAVVRDGRRVLSSAVFSQERLHRPFRGIVPEIASRAHVERMNRILQQALAGAGGARVDAIAVTVGPGLVGSLLVGKMTADALGWAWGAPVAGVNHLEAHLFANLLDHSDLEPPFLGLIVSGGHTDLVLVEHFGRYQTLGRTRDDAAGECFDKAANLLNLGYPGGPKIDALARFGDPKAVPFSRPYMPDTWDFSFSGLKTAVLYFCRDHRPGTYSVADVCASFQAAVVDVLVRKTVQAAKKLKVRRVAVGGGVSANSELRRRFLAAGKENALKVYLPSPAMCTDNAAMVAAAGYYKLRAPQGPSESLRVDPSLPIRNWP